MPTRAQKEAFGVLIREARIKGGFRDQTDFAGWLTEKKVPISNKGVSSWERGATAPDVHTVRQLDDLLGPLLGRNGALLDALGYTDAVADAQSSGQVPLRYVDEKIELLEHRLGFLERRVELLEADLAAPSEPPNRHLRAATSGKGSTAKKAPTKRPRAEPNE